VYLIFTVSVEVSGIAFTQILLFVIASRLSLGLIQPTVLWILGVFAPWKKWPLLTGLFINCEV